MKSSRTAATTAPSNSVKPSPSQPTSAATGARVTATLPANLRGNPAGSHTITANSLRSGGLRGQTTPSTASLTTGRKSPLRSGDLKAKRSLLVDVGGKSMKTHFLSKSNDSLSGGGGAVLLKKAKNHTTTPQSRGIRHPVVISSIQSASASQKRDKTSSSSTIILAPLNGAPTTPTVSTLNNPEMRRSVSSNCLDLPVGRDLDSSPRRLSIPDVNRLSDNMVLLAASSLLASNFAPSQSGITLVTTATQTESAVTSRRGSAFAEREFQSLLEEHSEMSKQLSELCRMEALTGVEGGDGDLDGQVMDTSDGGGMSRSLPSGGDWDAQSNNSLCSEPSLAGLQDRIQQMEETHHSTHEELQATLQELAELSDIVIVYKRENEELIHEKGVLQEALCAVTEKVQVYQSQADSLKKMLYRQVAGDENSMPEEGSASTENEKTLVELMRSLQEEKEESQHQLDSALEQNCKLSADLDDVHGKLQNLDRWCDQVESEKKEAERLLASARDTSKRHEMELTRVTALLETEKSKVAQLETMAKTTAKADLDDLLDQVRCEKNRVEEQLTNAENRIRGLENELEGKKAALDSSEGKKTDLERSLLSNAQEFAHRLDCKEMECRGLGEEVNRLKKSVDDLEGENRAKETDKAAILRRYDDLRAQYSSEQDDWTFFQNDLLTAVRVANEFRTECELKTKLITEENQVLKRKTEELTGEMERLKAKKAATPPKITLPMDADTRPRIDPLPLLRSPLMSASEREVMTPRLSRGAPNQVSVKSIIQNLESNGRQTGRALAAAAGKFSGIRRRDDNIVRSDSNSSLDSGDKLLDLERFMLDSSPYSSMLDDEPSMPGDGLKPILTVKQRNSLTGESKGSLHDSLGSLAKGKGSKRNALLKFCQEKTLGYSGIDITNFSSSWNDGLAFCALIHSYLPDRIPYRELDNKDKRRNFSLAFEAAKSVGVQPSLEINDLLSDDRPDWRAVMDYVISIYRHFEM